MQIQENITQGSAWIIDENSVRSLETRWKNAELMLYLNHNRTVCLHRLIKWLCIKEVLKAKYPSAKFIEINSDKDLENVETTI